MAMPEPKASSPPSITSTQRSWPSGVVRSDKTVASRSNNGVARDHVFAIKVDRAFEGAGHVTVVEPIENDLPRVHDSVHNSAGRGGDEVQRRHVLHDQCQTGRQVEIGDLPSRSSRVTENRAWRIGPRGRRPSARCKRLQGSARNRPTARPELCRQSSRCR